MTSLPRQHSARWVPFVMGLFLLVSFTSSANAQLNVLTVDCTPFVSPGFTAFGPDNTMGMALQQVDPGNVLFNVTEVTPAAFRGMSVAMLSSFDLIAINNRRNRIDCGSGLGLGTTWHNAIGVNNGGRVVLSSHDAPRFHLIVGPGTTPMGSAGVCANCEPFGAFNLVRDAALWAGGGPCTGLLIFNDSYAFETSGMGWDNPELNFPAAWSITDIAGPAIADGGYTDIVPAFTAHPIYANVNDTRLAPNSISSFAANQGDLSFHSLFQTHNNAIFTVTEQMINSGVVDPGGFQPACCSGTPVNIPNGTPITLIRDHNCPAIGVEESTWGNIKSIFQ